MGKKRTFLVAEKWSVGYRRSTGETTLVFEFAGREPINLLIPQKYAIQIAHGILEQYRSASPKRDRPG
jgi:hypothetical protein